MGHRAPLISVADYLDAYLRIAEVPDEAGAVNGLQVENRGEVAWIVAAVDASQAAIDATAERSRVHGAPALLLVHHGLFWDGNRPVTGRRYRRLRTLLDHDIAVYSAHLPLDVHPEVGNNAVLARELGVVDLGPFDQYKGNALGYQGRLQAPEPRDALVARIGELLGAPARLIPGGPPRASRVGVITGAAGSRIAAARDAGVDTFITGEGPHHTYFDAMELGVNVVYAGHYATEQVGVKALAAHLAPRFGLGWEFLHQPTGM
jgi:dinuclear metal center YbgI/SA1388 family protein